MHGKYQISRRLLLASSAALLSVGIGAKAADLPGKTNDTFTEKLIRAMSLEEKADQLSLYNGIGFGRRVNPMTGEAPTIESVKDQIEGGAVAGYFNSFDPASARNLQKTAVEESRLGIPLIFAADMIHGLRTGYPVPLDEAPSSDRYSSR